MYKLYPGRVEEFSCLLFRKDTCGVFTSLGLKCQVSNREQTTLAILIFWSPAFSVVIPEKGNVEHDSLLQIKVLQILGLRIKVSARIQTILAVLIFWAAPFSAQNRTSFPSVNSRLCPNAPQVCYVLHSVLLYLVQKHDLKDI